ncbi:P450 monooxygenase [Colletotrichum truncatum]|uniref:P450 monooxygenase n=1 Tax=Colletotrichum truncatum TaxID=5467 RepID=A0ACC3Z7P1_COLTU
MPDWSSVTLKPFVSNLVARLSARLFVGPELCCNKEWLELSTGYAIDCFLAAYALRRWTPFLRWPASWLLPECRALRKRVDDARRILEPLLSSRYGGSKPSQPNSEFKGRTEDTIDWLKDAFEKAGASAKYNVADAQLGLSIVAIHTTTELLTGALFDIIASGPQLVNELRQEIVTVFEADSIYQSCHRREKSIFNKTSLYELKLLDSTLKESQRVHTRGVGAMGRVAEEDVRLPDGLVIPKGASSIVTLAAYNNENLYPEPHKFNPRRFLQLRSQPGQEKNWQLVTTSPDHLGFGYGDHACPGRFLAANEVKIALVYLIMEYDWKLSGQRPEDTMVTGSVHQADAKAQVMFKKRASEVCLQ